MSGQSSFKETIALNRIEKDNTDEKIDLFFVKVFDIDAKIDELIGTISFTLLKNRDFTEDNISFSNEIQNDILSALYSIIKIRSALDTKRIKKNGFSLNRFARKLIIKKAFGKDKLIAIDLGKGVPLTNLSPAHSSTFSYDTYKKQVVNLVIPNERIMELIRKLKKGKFFGYKFSFLYSGKGMLFFDIVLFILFFSWELYMTLIYDSKSTDPLIINSLQYKISHSSYWVIRQSFVAPLVFFVAKIFLHDLTFWFETYAKFLNLIKFKK